MPPNEAKAAEPVYSVLISEIAWAGSSVSTADEWLELANVSDYEVDISGWHIQGAGASEKDLVIPDGTLLLPQATYLIANYPSGDTHSNLTTEAQTVTTTISLSNSTLAIRLLDKQHNLVDEAGNGSAPPAGYSQEVKASMARVLPAYPGTAIEAWKTSDVTINLNNADLGSPGYIGMTSIPFSTTTEPIINQTSTTAVDIVEDEIIPEAPTSTDSVTDIATTTGQSPEFTETSATSTEEASDEIAIETEDATIAEIISATTTEPDYSSLKINEFMPNPSTGSEWIELYASTTQGYSLENLELYDSVGKIASLHGFATSSYHVFLLSSSKLNNGGDTVTLKKSDGSIIDTFSFSQSHAGYSWARDANGDWSETVSPTQGKENAVNPPSPPVSIQIQTTETVASQPTIAPTATTTATVATKTNAQTSVQKSVAPKKTTVQKTAKSSTSSATKTTSAKQTTAGTKEVKKATAAKATTTKKTTTKSATATITNIDFDMLQDDSLGGIKIRIRGTVGTMSGLMTGRAFVLLNQDGRGLLVKLPTGLKYPLYGSSIELTGTLKFDTRDLPYISMLKGDKWNNISTLTSPEPKSLWATPSSEDAWSLVAATGTIQSISGQTVTILSGDYEYDIKIKTKTGYRASRLSKGDTISVIGLLDITNDRQAIIPRTAEEIVLASHAPEKKIESQDTAAAKKGIPGWTPFGAALGAIGAIEATKKIRSRITTAKKKVKA